jgi:hypothetical protein
VEDIFVSAAQHPSPHVVKNSKINTKYVAKIYKLWRNKARPQHVVFSSGKIRGMIPAMTGAAGGESAGK